MTRRAPSFNRMEGAGPVWYSDKRVPHQGAWYSGGNGSSLIHCDTCGLETVPRRWGTPNQEITRAFARVHAAAQRRGYTGRHRKPVVRPQRPVF